MRDGLQSRSRSLIFGTNRKRVCDFLLVINSNIGPILPRFRDRILQVSAEKSDPTLILPKFWGCYLGLDCRCCGSDFRGAKTVSGFFIIRVISFELTQHIRPRYINVTVGRTDGRLTIAIPRFALRASRGKNATILQML